MKFKNLTLDKFQEDAILSVDKNNSVVVSAATGTGKTLIADYIITKYLDTNKRIIYTAPIKALSNQKFRDFKRDYGDKIGLLTGDVSINERAQVLIMTTEIYRNMLLAKDPIVEDISYVIFDEIHYINDVERGTVWEESIIFSPEHIRFLCLSATIPNAEEFADWIKSIKHHSVDVIKYEKRAVPLKHFVFDVETGIMPIEDFKDYIINHKSLGFSKKKFKDYLYQLGEPNHVDLIKELNEQNFLPALFFTFSRKACLVKAKELAKEIDFLNSSEKAEVAELFHKMIPSNIKQMTTTRDLQKTLSRGIGVHNAGLLPVIKELVEILFSKGLIKVLYATETFAVGINMPAKTVCFSSIEKYDGISFRYLTMKEYFQLAGRAGRRGIDKIGRAIVLINRRRLDIHKISKIMDKDIEPIKSQFRLSYNTILNLVKSHNEEEIKTILKSNFWYFQSKNKNNKIYLSYKNKLKILIKLDYVTPDKNLTWKGNFASLIYSNELLISELIYRGFFDKLDNYQIISLIGAIIYEPRLSDKFETRRYDNRYSKLVKIISSDNYIYKKIKLKNLRNLIPICYAWSQNVEFSELLELTNLAEGDIIRFFRQIIDQLEQIKHASDDKELRSKINSIISLIDRDIVKIEF